jgi:two-component system nitrate/nitrite response regulator NarL
MSGVPGQKRYGLTARKIEIIRCIVEGSSNRDTARQFAHQRRDRKAPFIICNKTGVSKRLEIALFAMSHYLVERPAPR